MKTIKILPTILIATIAFCFIQCTEMAKKDTTTNDDSTTETNTMVPHLPKATFVNWVTAWKADGVTYTDSTLLEFFTMSDGDLTAILNESGVDSARFYLGLDTSIIPNEPHLMVVGVDSNGNDMLDYTKGQYAYDLTKPCPSYCTGGYGYPKNPKK